MTELPQMKVEANYRRGGERRVSVAGESVNEEELASSKKIYHEKSQEARKRLAEITSKNLLIRNLDRKQKEGAFYFIFH